MAEGVFDPQILVPADLDVSSGHQARIGRILVIQGDPVARELASSVLRRTGHMVVRVERGSTALRELETDHEGFDLVITDLVMPDMTGPQFANRVHLSRPTLPVLFISGYSDELVEHQVEVAQFVAKPYSAEALLATVSSLLQRYAAES